MSSRRSLVALLLAACGPGPGATDTGSSTGSSTEVLSTSSTAPTDTGTTATQEPCGCADPQVVDDNLDVAGLGAFAGGCIGEITGRLRIEGVSDPSVLQPLVGLRRVNTLQIFDNPGLVDLAPLACLEQISDGLELSANPALVDLEALARVRVARSLTLRELPITALPGFAPEYVGARTLSLRDLPALTDLDAIAGWPSVVAESGAFGLEISNAPTLHSIAGLAGPLGSPDIPDVQLFIELDDLPALTDLTGLEAQRDGRLTLRHLPKITSLAPLSELTQLEELRLVGLPGLTTLHGLHALKQVQELQLGGCSDGDGLDGLTDLTGLDALTGVGILLSIVRNPGLTALTGAPKLLTIGASFGGLDLVENSQLGADAVAALDAQADISHLCFGDSVQCGCLREVPESVRQTCATAWSGGSAVTAGGDGGPLTGTTAYFGWRGSGLDNPALDLVVIDAAADIEAAMADGLWQRSDAGTPKLVVTTQLSYQDWIGTTALGEARLIQPGPQTTELALEILVTERAGDWTTFDPADPPRLIGEITTKDPNGTTTVTGPFDAAYCDAFSEALSD